MGFYKLGNPRHCPHCNSKVPGSIMYINTTYDKDMLYHNWKCMLCGAKGQESYKLKFKGHKNIVLEEKNYGSL